MSDGPLADYRAMRAAGTLRYDPDQELAAEKLEALTRALAGYRPGGPRERWKTWFARADAPRETPQGLYLYGGVGRGKSMLMDLFFHTAPLAHKKRVHFHRFMLDAHRFLHDWRSAATGGGGRSVGDGLPELARRIAADAWLLCFDEFHVSDVADAMILGRLFTALFDLGVVVVATSNWPPDELYAGGLQRDRFLPFIALLKDRLDVLALEHGPDHRRLRLERLPVYFQPLDHAATEGMGRAFAERTDQARGGPMSLALPGRTVEVPYCAAGVAWFHFYDLCGKPLGAADYLAIATHFHTVLLDRVPRLEPAARDQAKRLMILIDALYEHRVKLVMAADGPPTALYPAGDHAFAFERTVSRLIEMQTDSYRARPHLT